MQEPGGGIDAAGFGYAMKDREVPEVHRPPYQKDNAGMLTMYL
jgi:hypothetical protein